MFGRDVDDCSNCSRLVMWWLFMTELIHTPTEKHCYKRRKRPISGIGGQNFVCIVSSLRSHSRVLQF